MLLIEQVVSTNFSKHGSCSQTNDCLVGALTLASVLLYPRTLGGGAVFSGWVPFNSSIIARISPEAKKVVNYSISTSLACLE